MSDVFGATYAWAYDRLYQGKDYAAECRLVEGLAKTYGGMVAGRLIDFGCGTGGHAIPLTKRGWRVSGVDRSPEMLAIARDKAAAEGVTIDAHEGDVCDITVGRDYDLALMMFAVLGYQKSNAAVAAALANVRRHLRLGGVFIFDVWHGPAVVAEKPGERVKRIALDDGEILRSVKGSLDIRHHVCSVDYDLQTLRNGRCERRVREHHDMRYFFPLEIEYFLERAQFETLRLASFDDPEREPGPTDWNMIVVAKAV